MKHCPKTLGELDLRFAFGLRCFCTIAALGKDEEISKTQTSAEKVNETQTAAHAADKLIDE